MITPSNIKIRTQNFKSSVFSFFFLFLYINFKFAYNLHFQFSIIHVAEYLTRTIPLFHTYNATFYSLFNKLLIICSQHSDVTDFLTLNTVQFCKRHWSRKQNLMVIYKICLNIEFKLSIIGIEISLFCSLCCMFVIIRLQPNDER